MSIKDVEKLNARQMDNLRNKQKAEVSRIEEGHKDLKTEIKKFNDKEIVDIQMENERKVVTESEKKEKILLQLNNHLDETRRFTDREIKDLKAFSTKAKQDEYLKLSADRERVKSENDLYLEELQYRADTEQSKINYESQNQMKNLKDVRGEEIRTTNDFYENKINDQTNKFTERFQLDNRTQTKINDDMDRQFKDQRFATNNRQATEVAKMTETHNSTLEKRDDVFRKGLKTQDKMFEDKYAVTLKTRNEELDSLNKLNDKVMAKMKQDLTETLKSGIDRSDDPFYRFTELKPVMKQFEDRVEIAIAIPEHAKGDVQLTIHNKEAIINFNRRYDDSRKEEGVENKLHKVESFTTRLATNHHLDAKSVKANYDSGTMTYVVKKS